MFHFFLKSNTDIYDILDDKYQSYEILKNVNFGDSSLKRSIAKLFNLKWLYYLKISKHQTDVEFRFLSENFATDMAANKFLNRLQQQLFIYEEEQGDESKTYLKRDSKNVQKASHSLKFVLKETDFLEYFKENTISLRIHK